jgi:multimeric flavodoxin WrbA
MKVIAINGSPRKQWNTAMLLQSALNGAAAAGAETELIHLYDINFKGCTSCFECKRIGSNSYGRCAMNDALTPVLESFGQADAAIFGSPLYFGNISGELKSFLERLWFPYLMYTKKLERSLFPRTLNTLFVYTSNAPEGQIMISGLDKFLSGNERMCAMLFKGKSSSYYCTETLQLDDYSKYVSDMFDENSRIRRRNEVFPKQLLDLYELGEGLLS